MEKVNIFLDDCREAPKGFIRTYTVEETLSLLDYYEGNVGILSLDNDLGEGLREGWEVMAEIEKAYYTKGYKLPDKIQIHSMNPVAGKRMNDIINKLYNKG